MSPQIIAWLKYAKTEGYKDFTEAWNLYLDTDDGEVESILTNATGDEPADAVAYLTKFHEEFEKLATQGT